MMNIIRTEYSFKEVFYHLEQAIDDSIAGGHDSICIMDNTTFGYVKFEKLCREKGVKPIFGLRLFLTGEKITSKAKMESFSTCKEVFAVALTQEGISELYRLYTKSTEQKYWFNRIYVEDINSADIMVFTEEEVCIPFARYSTPADIAAYQCISGDRGLPVRHEEYLGDIDLLQYWSQVQIDAKNEIADFVEDYELPRAGMIKYNGRENFESKCWEGLIRLGFSDNGEYVKRLDYEIDIIRSKNFQDYFMIVAEMIADAKGSMITGPGRGSSGGSLVCYSLGITNIDPIRFGLIFERFIDANRNDLPDIDSDYPDTSRQNVIKQVAKRYQSAIPLGTITTYQPRTALNDFAKAYDIPLYELDELKEAIVERQRGDDRADKCLLDTFTTTPAGVAFLEKYPEMENSYKAEEHARHSGKHAAGLIVLDEPITNYAAYNATTGTLCLEGDDAESLGLLKIDCLGLRTLSVIENCLQLSGVDVNEIYAVDLEDKDVLSVFNTLDMSDVFQFDGDTIKKVNDSLGVKQFSDLAAITALGRPGALSSGGTNRYIKVASGDEAPVYYGETFQRITEETHGVVVYQEQVMALLREYAGMDWKDVNILRKAFSKSLGDSFFASYKETFIDNATDNGEPLHDVLEVWDTIASMGSYAFNKSHAVAYAMISYWCAYCKHHYGLNFLAANLNNVKDDDHGLRMLRKYVETHDIEYVPVDPDTSDVGWTIQDGKLVGGFTNLHGIGVAKAKDIIRRRESGQQYTKAIADKLENPVTPYDSLYPITERHKQLYDEWDIAFIENLEDDQQQVVIGTITEKELKDRNSAKALAKRDGKKVNEYQYYLSVVVSDDTGSIRCTIPPFQMDEKDGYQIADDLHPGMDVAVYGKYQNKFNNISIISIKPISEVT